MSQVKNGYQLDQSIFFVALAQTEIMPEVNNIPSNEVQVIDTSAQKVVVKKTEVLRNKNIDIVYQSTDTGSIKFTKNEAIFLEKPNTISSNFLTKVNTKPLCDKFQTKLQSPSLRVKTVNTSTVQAAKLTPETGFYGIPRIEIISFGLPILLILSLFVFAWVKLLFQKYIVQIIVSVFDYQASVRMFRERNVLYRNMSIGLNIVFAINSGIFIYFVLQHFQVIAVKEVNVFYILLISISILILYSLKSLVCKLIGTIFLIQDEVSEYIYNVHLMNKNLGLYLFPIIILYPYIYSFIQDYVLFIGIILTVILLIFRIFRGFQIIMRNEVHFFYLILYLCAVEILPVLLLLKLSTVFV